ncbi:MAG: hypothetical protein V4631_05250 [Pseudomonadota bacterium]
MADSKPSERNIPPHRDAKGGVEWRSQMTAPNDSVAVINMVSDRLIPIVFVPGVMGTNLRGIGDAKGINWRLDTGASMVGWLNRDEDERKKFLTPATMRVDDGGALPKGTTLPDAEMKRRGWGEVGAVSYTEFLVWLEHAFSDFTDPKNGVRHELIGQALGAAKGETALSKDDVALSYKYRFPVHACGYNWLDDNAVSAERLKKRINQIIKYYQEKRYKCENVIIVTHSMGGLVARHCTENLGMSNIVLGVVHGVMPATGAAAVYRRLQAGTEGDKLPSWVLGEDAGEMTAVLAGAPGPMQLLPTPQYGNEWLRIRETVAGKLHEITLPKSNPYSEVYLVRGKWWSMVSDRLINPLLDDGADDYKKQLDGEWKKYAEMMILVVEPFHKALQDKYHCNTHAFYGSHADNKSFGNVTWQAKDDFELLGRGKRRADIINGERTALSEIKETRTVESKLFDTGLKSSIEQVYTISKPEEPGDGTVPHRSGVAPIKHASVKSMLRVKAGHEPAYRESMPARRFTLRAIVQIAREVENTSLVYKK